jgi:hypothetical protein
VKVFEFLKVFILSGAQAKIKRMIRGDDGKRLRNIGNAIISHAGICLEGLRKTTEPHVQDDQ